MYQTRTMAQVMTPDPVTISATETLLAGRALLHRHGIRHLPVVSGRELVGLLFERDLHKESSFRYPRSLRVADFMRERPYALTTMCSLSEAIRMMATYKFEAIPIVSGHRALEGIFTRHDALKAIARAETGWRRPEPPVRAA